MKLYLIHGTYSLACIVINIYVGEREVLFAVTNMSITYISLEIVMVLFYYSLDESYW
jgi:hypothetical protein